MACWQRRARGGGLWMLGVAALAVSIAVGCGRDQRSRIGQGASDRASAPRGPDGSGGERGEGGAGPGRDNVPPTEPPLGACNADICCPETQALCSDECVTLEDDADHCGACGNVCGEGEVCGGGQCLPCGDVPFVESEVFDVGGSEGVPLTALLPVESQWHDVDGDGRLDLVVPSPGQSRLAMLLGRQDGGFGEPIFIESARFGQLVRIADVDRDGFDDMVVAGLDELAIHWGRSSGWFESARFFSFERPGDTSHGVGLELIDWNDDGPLEIAILSSPSIYGTRATPVQLLIYGLGRNRSELEHLATPFDAALGSWFSSMFYRPRLQALDVNGDGALDLALLHREVTLFTSGPSGRERVDDWTTEEDNYNFALRIVDQDGDGELDVVTTRPTGQGTLVYGYRLGVLRGQGDGSFEKLDFPEQATGDSGRPHVVLTDLNGDGFLDAMSEGRGVAWTHWGSADGFVEEPVVSRFGGSGGLSFEPVETGWGTQGGSGEEPRLAALTGGLLSVLSADESGSFPSHFLASPEGLALRDAAALVPRDDGDGGAEGRGGATPQAARIVAVGWDSDAGLHVLSLGEDGTLRSEEQHVIYRPETVTLGDVDGDGWADAVVQAENQIVWLRRLGDFAFGPPARIVGHEGDVELGDVDGDGVADVVVGRRYGDESSLKWFRLAAAGTWDEGSVALESHYRALSLVDGDRDGPLEVFTSIGEIGSSYRAQVWKWDGEGLTARSSAETIGLVNDHAALAPAVGESPFLYVSSTYGGHDVLRWEDGALEWLAHRPFPGLNGTQLVVPSEVLTGRAGEEPYLLIANGGRMETWTASASGTLERETSFALPGATRTEGLADFTGDGVLDLLAAGGSSTNRSLSVLPGQALCGGTE